MTGDGELVVTRVRWFGARLEGARLDDEQPRLSDFVVAQEPGAGTSLASADLAHGGADSCDFVVVWVDEPLPGRNAPEIRARRFRAGIFADCFESGVPSEWSAVGP